MEKHEREKTNSITHLVKIIANEEIDKRIHKMKIYSTNYKDMEEKILSSLLSNITNSLEQVGQKWETEEDNLLSVEIELAITQIAKNHHRSKGAITSRIIKKNLIKHY